MSILGGTKIKFQKNYTRMIATSAEHAEPLNNIYIVNPVGRRVPGRPGRRWHDVSK
jgi:hypothetical protein